VVLDEMPLTPNGKVDRQALPVPDLQFGGNSNFVAPRDTLELQLTRIWEEVLNLPTIGIRDNFFDLGGHSLLAISLISQIQQQFGQTLSLAAFFQGATIEDMANLLRQETDEPEWSVLVPIQSKGDRPPFFCVHPGAGTVLAYVELARHLGTDRPFYGLESLGLDADESHDQVEDMATNYIVAMQTVQPHGPYHLGGWSFGGLVAFEIAQQLRDRGEEVALLALFDTSAEMDLEDFQTDIDPSQREQDITTFLEELLAEEAHNLGLPANLDAPRSQRLVQLFKSHINAADTYIPQPYPGKITLFLAEAGLVTESSDSTLGWGALATEGVDIQSIPGEHHTIVSQPNVRVLADKLQEQLTINN
jgi:thioesterase domain-containing protein/acyl carrier protein